MPKRLIRSRFRRVVRYAIGGLLSCVGGTFAVEQENRETAAAAIQTSDTVTTGKADNSVGTATDQDEIARLSIKGRSQYLAGDAQGARVG